MLVVAGSAVILSLNAAGAADLGLPPPPPPPVEFSGWYLRGDIGFTNQQVDHANYNFGALAPPDSVQTIHKNFETGGLFGLGVGYQFNNWLRVDVTGEYRTASTFHGYEINTFGATTVSEHNTLIKTEWVALANVYADLGTWWCVTPFVGAGIGASSVILDGFEDRSIIDTGANVFHANNYAGRGEKWNFAWAAYAGLAYKVTPGFTIELAYRYLYLGDGQTGSPITGYDGTYQGAFYELKDIDSHDLKIGVRWMLAPEPVYAPPPLIRKG
jgi:opacity protein-like surface antigen